MNIKIISFVLLSLAAFHYASVELQVQGAVLAKNPNAACDPTTGPTGPTG